MPGMQPNDIAVVAVVGEVQLDPVGRRVAYTVTTVDEGANRYKTRIWLASVDGSGPPRPLTAGDSSDLLPRWSPDGASLAFVSSRGEPPTTGVWILPVEGPGEAVRVCSWPDSISELSWAPTGERLAFVGRNPEPGPIRRTGRASQAGGRAAPPGHPPLQPPQRRGLGLRPPPTALRRPCRRLVAAVAGRGGSLSFALARLVS